MNTKQPREDTAIGGTSDARGRQSARTMAFLPSVPVFFLGIGIYRAWIELVYVYPPVEFPAEHTSLEISNFAMIGALLLCAVLARRIAPLYGKRWVYVGTGLLMTAGTAASFWSLFHPSMSSVIVVAGAVASGVGLALTILLWSELFSSLNPARVVFYYSLSLLFGALIVLVMRGFLLNHFMVFTLLLPALSLLCVAMSFRAIPEGERPRKEWVSFSFPWKPVALMAVYALAYGIRTDIISVSEGPHSSWGVVFAATLVVISVALRGERFDLAILYRVGLPLMVGGLLLVPLVAPSDSFISNFCVEASYTSFTILIMIILSNISHRFGVSAVWLFGIERGLRLLIAKFGAFIAGVLAENGNPGVTLSAAMTAILICTLIFLPEKNLLSDWGMTQLGGDGVNDETRERERLRGVCAQLAAEYGLSRREAEVLELLVRKRSIVDIEQELLITTGTVKSHIGHIHSKMGIHSRKELFRLLEQHES